MNMLGGYVLVQDEGKHWFVIPHRMAAVWARMLECAEEDGGMTIPEWAHRVKGGVGRVVFNSYHFTPIETKKGNVEGSGD